MRETPSKTTFSLFWETGFLQRSRSSPFLARKERKMTEDEMREQEALAEVRERIRRASRWNREVWEVDYYIKFGHWPECDLSRGDGGSWE